VAPSVVAVYGWQMQINIGVPKILLTQTGAIEAFKHILSNVFKVPDVGPLAKALKRAGYDDIWTLVPLCNANIESTDI